MLTQRLQVLLDPELKARLERAARDRGTSVGKVVRAALTTELGAAPSADRHRALDELFALRAPDLTVEEMNEIVERDLAEDFERLHGGEPGGPEAPGRLRTR